MRNEKKMGARAIAQIAKNNGISETEVRSEIEEALREGYSNNDTRKKWDEIFGKDVMPSPEEFIIKMAKVLQKDH